ncbi:protein lin-52 isoform X1 [Willisornis vidua]|uniref:Protein lin-52 homolog n=1 Tax=Willisornis vidua TaxID=1566151 RepID=A0ABQ9D182_9PASS|nr:protein lin-52 isoform X1 [Willisornis vidua]
MEAPADGADLEASLLSFEKLDRASPDLWPEQLPGVAEFAASFKSPITSSPPKWMAELENDDIDMLKELGSLTTANLMEKVRGLQNLAYQLGLDELDNADNIIPVQALQCKVQRHSLQEMWCEEVSAEQQLVSAKSEKNSIARTTQTCELSVYKMSGHKAKPLAGVSRLQPKKSFVPFLTVVIPSLLQPGCAKFLELVDEPTASVPALSPATFTSGIWVLLKDRHRAGLLPVLLQ